MITIFSVPKPFRGHIGIIQTNALESWVRLSPPCEIILVGDEEGLAEAAARCGVRHVPDVLRSQFGTPLLNSVFERAQALATHSLMCYVNADVIFLSDFSEAGTRISRLKRSFLMVGRRWDIDLREALNFDEPRWEERLRSYVCKYGKPRPPEWIDYFVFPRGFYQHLPPFVIGRAAFDNWLLWKARSLKGALVDASAVIMAVHQNHDYSHHPEGKKGVWEGAEAERNRELMGGWHHCFTLDDATHRLTATDLKINLYSGYVRRRWEAIQTALMTWTRPLRNRFGLRRANLERLSSLVKKAFGIFSGAEVD